MKIKVLFSSFIFILTITSIGSSEYLSYSMKKAAKDGSIMQIEELSKKGEDLNSVDENGWTPLMWASYYNHSRMVEYLLNKGTNVNQKSANGTFKVIRGSSALHIAALYNFEEIVKALLDNKADINATDGKGRTALLIASYYGHSEIARTLLQKGADRNIPDDSRKTPLDYAAKYSFTEIYELLTGKDIVTGKSTETEPGRIYNEGKLVGLVKSVDIAGNEIIVSSVVIGQLVNIGDTLYCVLDGVKINMEVTFPMQTIARCKIIDKKNITKLKNGETVYK